MNRVLARSAIYNILSLCYTYPDKEISTWMAGGEWINEMRESLKLLAEEGFDRHLQAFKKILAEDREDFPLNLSREYTRLFINAFPHVIAPPYGAVYLEKEGKVFGKTTSEVLRFYHEVGFGLREDLGDLPDHISHELEFMAILTGQEAQASGNEKVRLEEVQIAFLTRFIQSWIPEFCEKVAQQSQLDFYRVLAEVTQEDILLEKNYLGIPEEMDPHNYMEYENRGG